MALKDAGFQQAYNKGQIRVRGKQVRLWVIAEPGEAKRLLEIDDPEELATEYLKQRRES